MNQLTTTAIDTRAKLDLARAFADSKMVPEHFKKSVGDCYIAIGLADRYRMDPWTLMQEMYIIQGKPMMSGKLAAAILNNSLADPLRPEYSGAGDERTIVLSGRPEGEDKTLSVELKVRDAKTANAQWSKIPDQMLFYAAARMWGRRYTPDILLGIVFDDEEMTEINPAQPTTRTPIASPKQQHAEVIDEKTGEVFDAPVELPKNPEEKWYDWGARFVACFRGAPDIDTIDRWLAANSELLAECEKEAKKVHGNIGSAVNTCKMDLMKREETAT